MIQTCLLCRDCGATQTHLSHNGCALILTLLLWSGCEPTLTLRSINACVESRRHRLLSAHAQDPMHPSSSPPACLSITITLARHLRNIRSPLDKAAWRGLERCLQDTGQLRSTRGAQLVICLTRDPDCHQDQSYKCDLDGPVRQRCAPVGRVRSRESLIRVRWRACAELRLWSSLRRRYPPASPRSDLPSCRALIE